MQVYQLKKSMGLATDDKDIAHLSTAMAVEMTALVKACGEASVHNLEVEVKAPLFQASAFTGVKMVGIDRVFDW